MITKDAAVATGVCVCVCVCVYGACNATYCMFVDTLVSWQRKHMQKWPVVGDKRKDVEIKPRFYMIDLFFESTINAAHEKQTLVICD